MVQLLPLPLPLLLPLRLLLLTTITIFSATTATTTTAAAAATTTVIMMMSTSAISISIINRENLIKIQSSSQRVLQTGLAPRNYQDILVAGDIVPWHRNPAPPVDVVRGLGWELRGCGWEASRK